MLMTPFSRFSVKVDESKILGTLEPLTNRVPEDCVKPGETIPVQEFQEGLGQVLKVILSDWFTPKNFYVQLRRNLSKLEAMMQKLNKFYNDMEKKTLFSVEFLPGVNGLHGKYCHNFLYTYDLLNNNYLYFLVLNVNEKVVLS